MRPPKREKTWYLWCFQPNGGLLFKNLEGESQGFSRTLFFILETSPKPPSPGADCRKKGQWTNHHSPSLESWDNFFFLQKKTWLMAGSITTAFSEGGMFSCDLQVPSRDQLRPHTSSNQKDSNYLDCSLTWPLMNIAYGAGRQWQKMLPGAGVTYGSNILITRLGGTTCHCTTLYHIVPRCVVRHTPLQTDYWLKEPLVSQAEFHVAACTTRKKVATYKPNWTMQSKIIQPRAINHDWTLFHTCYNSKCETFDTQELASIMCFELKTRHPNFSW